MSKRVILISVGVAAVVVFGVWIAAFIAVRVADVRQIAEARLEGMTGREVAVGEAGLELSLWPRLTLTDVTIADAPWSTSGPMLKLDHIAVDLALPPLITDGALRVDRVAAAGAEAVVALGPQGLNWAFPRSGDPSANPPDIDSIELRDVRLTIRNGGERLNAQVSHLRWSDGEPTSRIEAEGQAKNVPFSLEGDLPALPALLESQVAGLDIDGWFGATKLAVSATDAGYDVALSGSDIGGSLMQVGLDGPELPLPFTVEAALATQDGGGWALRDIDAEIAGEGLQLTIDGSVTDLFAAPHPDLAVQVQASSLAALGSRLGRNVPELGGFSAEARIGGTGREIVVSEVSGSIGAGRPTTLRFAGGEITVATSPLSLAGGIPLELQGASFAETGKAFGLSLPRLGSYRLAGTLDPREAAVTGISGTVGTGPTAVAVQAGRVENLFAEPRLEVRLRAAHDSLAPLVEVFGFDLDVAAPYRAEARLVVDAAGVAVPELSGAIGSAPATIDVSGSIAGFRPALRGIEFQIASRGPTLARLSPTLGVDLPDTPPYSFSVQVSRSGESWRFADLQAALGKSRLAGNLALDPSGPNLTGSLQSPLLEIDTLLDAVPDAGKTGQQDGAAESGNGPPAQWLTAFSGSIEFRADRLVVAGEAISDVALDLKLADGNLTAAPFRVVLSGGAVRGRGSIDASGEALDISVRATGDDIALGPLLSQDGAAAITGSTDFKLSLEGSGRTVQQVVEGLQGQLSLVLEDGRLEDDTLHRMVPDLDLFGFLWKQDQDLTLNCLVGRFGVEDGQVQTKGLLDTRRMSVIGKGTIDLADRQLDLRLSPEAKTKQLSSLAVPVVIEGPLSDPAIKPQASAVVQAPLKLIGGLLLPLRAVGALLGQESTDACKQAVQQARDQMGRSERPAKPPSAAPAR